MRTIPRSHKAVIADIKARFTRCEIMSLDYGFIARPCEPRYAWSQLDANKRTKLVEESKGEKYVIQVHSNLWYVLTLPEGK